MKNKKIMYVIILIMIAIIIYFAYKCFNLFYYNIDNVTTVDYKSIISGLKVKDNMTISSKSIDEDNYITFKNVKIKNEFSNFKVLENQSNDDTIKYALYDNSNNVKASFWMGETYSYVYMLRNDSTLFGTDEKRISNSNLTQILEKNNIKSDIELFDYLSKLDNVGNNILTPVSKMKENFAIQFMTAVITPTINGITILDGDYQGYMFNIKNDNLSTISEARILHNDKVYTFLFLSKDGTYFSKDYINELLNTIVIN